MTDLWRSAVEIEEGKWYLTSWCGNPAPCRILKDCGDGKYSVKIYSTHAKYTRFKRAQEIVCPIDDPRITTQLINAIKQLIKWFKEL